MEEPFARKTYALKKVLRAVLKRAGLPRRKAAGELADAWDAAVGPGGEGRTNVAGYRNGVLTVEVDRSELLMELEGFRKRELLKKLSRSASRYIIRDIRFRLRPEHKGGEGER